MQEGQPSKQIVHQALRPVWLVRITASAGTETGEVNGITEVDAGLGLVSLKKGQERFAGLWVNVGPVATTNSDPFFPFTGKARHDAAAYVKVLGGNEPSQTKK
jgi:hypothetical protein